MILIKKFGCKLWQDLREKTGKSVHQWSRKLWRYSKQRRSKWSIHQNALQKNTKSSWVAVPPPICAANISDPFLKLSKEEVCHYLDKCAEIVSCFVLIDLPEPLSDQFLGLRFALNRTKSLVVSPSQALTCKTELSAPNRSVSTAPGHKWGAPSNRLPLSCDVS